MTPRIWIIGFILTFFSFYGSAQAPLASRVNASALIVEATVLSHTSSWNAQHTAIFTTYRIAVGDQLKGTASGELEFQLAGGRAGNDLMTASSSPVLQPESKGIFFFSISGDGSLQLLPGTAGYIPYVNEWTPVTDGLVIYPAAGALKQELSLITGATWSSPGQEVLRTAPQIASVPALSGFSPAIVRAGTGDVLTITGTGFGAVQGSGKVLFTNADIAGLVRNVEPFAGEYLQWSDTSIKVRVPSIGAAGNGTAGTGKIEVVNSSGDNVVSANNLTVLYSVVNLNDNGVPVRPDLINDNGSGGFTFTLYDSIAQHAVMRQTIFGALERWTCATQSNYTVDFSGSSTAAAGADGVNIVRFDSMSTFIMGVVYSFYSNCSGTWYLNESDVVFNNQVNWNYGPGIPAVTQADFESCCMTLFGFALLADHVLDTNDVMHGDAPPNGVTRRSLVQNNLDGVQSTLTLSTAPNTCGPSSHQLNASCAIGAPVDADVYRITWPYTGFCQGTFPVTAQLINRGQNTLTSAQFNWTYDGIPQTPFAWSGSLLHDDTSAVIVGNVNLTSGTHTIIVWSAAPNSVSDYYQDNDTASSVLVIGTCTTANAGVNGLVNPVMSMCPGQHNVSVTVRNYATTPLNYVQIHWKVNGVTQTPYTWSGTIPASSTSPPIIIGTHNFSAFTNTIKAWTVYPNGLTDITPSNDTLNGNYNPNGMTGTYTVGGASPDFIDFQTAISNLNGRGLCGPVILDIRPGTYAGGVTLTAQTNAAKTLLIRSSTGDSSSVIISGASGNVFTINGSDFVTVEKITLRTTDATTSTVCSITNDANNITIANCVFEMPVLALLNQNVVGVWCSGLPCDTIRISHCRFENGSTGIVFVPSSGTGNTALIEHCIVRRQSDEGLGVNGYSGVEIRYCEIDMQNSTGAGIAMQFCNWGFSIHHNTVITNAQIAIDIQQCVGTSLARADVYNNFITVLNYTNGSAVVFDGSSWMNFRHNTINANCRQLFYIRVASTTPVIAPHLTINNNIFSATNQVSHIYFITAYVNVNFFDGLSHNAYSYGDAFGELPNNTVAYSLTQWMGYTQSDTGSVEFTPDFISATDLHLVPNAANQAVYNSGASYPGITDDIDGDIRNATPDIGADEFGFHSNDVSVTDVQPVGRTCAGVNPVTVELTNFGTAPLTSAVIHWKVNNVMQPSFNWNGVVQSNASSGQITIGTLNFVTASVYTIVAWTDQPNASADGYTGNDTLSRMVIGGGMNGVYTIGGTSPNYSTITAAKNALASLGVCGHVVFNIRPGTYNEQVTFPIIVGASSSATITFQAENGDSSSVILSGGSGFAVTVSNGGYYTFSRLTITSTTNSVSLNSTQHTTFSHCVITHPVVSAINTVNSDLTVEYSRLNQELILDGYSVHNGSFWVDHVHQGVVVRKNHFTYGGLDFTGVSNVTVTGNTFANVVTQYGVSLTEVFDTLVVSGNSIRSFSNLGLEIDYRGGALYNVPLVSNNMIVDSSNYTCALWVVTNTSFDILNNTCRSIGPGTGGMTLYARLSMNGVLRIYNNVLTNLHFGPALDINVGVNSPGIIESDYNALYSTGATLAQSAALYPTLPQWTSATGFDAHSVFALPQFVSPTDLHINSDVMLMDAGTPLSRVALDYDGQARNATTPDIGADEYIFIPQALDAGVHSIQVPFPACAGNAPVEANIRNYGSTVLTSAVVNWTVDGVPQTPYNWSGSLNLLDSTGMITIGTYNFTAPATYTVVVWVSAPNSGVDQVPNNDAAPLYNYIPRLGGVYTIGGTNPDFFTVAQAVMDLNQVGVCGPVTFNLRPGNYSWSTALQNVQGSGPAAPITFQSENADSSTVHLSWIELGNSSYVNFHQINITSNPDMGTATSHIAFTNCWFSSASMVSTGVNNFFLFENCLWTASASFSANSSSSPEMGTVFRNNRFENCATLTVYGQKNCLITGNTFDCPTSVSNEALAFNGFRDSCRITGNFIQGGYQQGMYMNGGNSAVEPLLIANNMIAGGTTMNTGIVFGSTTSGIARVYSNNVNITGAGSCVQLSNANICLFNNVLKANTGFAYIVSTAGSLDSSDYNDLYTGGPVLARWLSTNCSTLVALQTTSGGMEMNSVNADPLYVSPVDLHILNMALNGAGTMRPQVSDDYDGEARLNPPDIGADERNFYPHDAGVIALVQPVPACEGVNPFSVTIKNFGTQPLTALTIQWSLNAVMQTPVAWTGSLPSGSNTNVVLGNLNLAHASVNSLVVWTENPNAMADGFTGNDTLSETIAPRMAGVFTIGGTAPDYPDFTSAIADLTTFGVCGPVVFDVRNGVYNEQITIGVIAGSNATNTITFQSEQHDSTLVELSYYSGSLNNYVIWITGTNYITFREMTIKALNPQYGHLVFATGLLNGVNFTNNYLLGSAAQPAVPYDHILLRMDFTAGSADCYVSNNYFRYGGAGAYLHGPAAVNDTCSFVIDNRFEDQYLRGIFFEKQYYQVITGNVITSANPHDVYVGMDSYLQNFYPYIAYNRVMLTGGTALLMNELAGGTIANNFVTIQQDTGVYVYGCLGLSDCNSVDVYHNTFINYGNRRYATTISISGGSFLLEFRNNVIANMGAGGFAVRWNQQTNVFNNTLDNNAYYNCCSDTLFYGTTTQVQTVWNDLAEWQTTMGQDMNSVFAPPQNISPFDERIISNSFFDNIGVPIAAVPVDLSGQTHGSTPDAGADEFTSVANDIAAVSVRATNAACGGGNVTCVIGNFGTNTVTSAQVHWSVNGTPQPVYNWSGTIAPASYSQTLALGSYTFSTGDELKVWTALPNSVADANPGTDTALCGVIRYVIQPDLGPDITECAGQNIVLAPGTYASYLWSTGSTGNSLIVSTTGVYSVIVMTPDSCFLYDTISVTILPGPPVPVVTQNGSNLLSSSPTGNQWYFNASPIIGATGQLYVATQTGQYHVVVTDQNGCTSSSGPVYVVGIEDAATTLPGVQVYPNPSDGAFTVGFYSESTRNIVTIFDVTGRIVYTTNEFVMDNAHVTMQVDADLPGGMYLLEVRSGEAISVSRIIIQ